MVIPLSKLACDAGLFFGCPDQQRDELLSCLDAVELHFREGTCIGKAGDKGDRFWIIERGQVDVVGHSDGRQVLLLTRRPGEIVGEGGITKPGQLRSADMICSRYTVAYEIRLAAVEALPNDLKAIFWRSLAAAINGKLAESVGERAGQSALINGYHVHVRRFANEHVLSRAAPSAKEVMARSETAVVWFSDVEGFSKFSETRSPEEVGVAIRELMNIQTIAIESRYGYIDKYIGDGLMAYWIAESEQQLPDLASAAFEAALDASNSIQAVEGGMFGLRIGLHTGPCVSGNFGSTDRFGFTLIGDTVNSAARYEQARKDVDGRELGPIRVSDVVFGLLTEQQRSLLSARTEFTDKHDRRFPVSSGGIRR